MLRRCAVRLVASVAALAVNVAHCNETTPTAGRCPKVGIRTGKLTLFDDARSNFRQQQKPYRAAVLR
jgi:hypothetical protein